MKAKSAICIVAAAGFLAACGGGDGSSSPAPVANADAQGFWQGTTSNGRTVNALVLENGQYYAVYSSDNVVNGMIQGTFAVNGTAISDSSAVDFAIGVGALPAKITGSVATKQSITGTVVETGGSINFNGNYNAAYDTPATLSQVAGTWTGHTTGTSVTTTLTAASSGAFSGISGTCAFTGSVAPRASGKAVFDGSVTFNSGDCQLGVGTTVQFEAVISGTQMIAAGVNSARSNGFIFLGIKS